MPEETRVLRYDGSAATFRLPAHDISVEAGETFEVDAETAAAIVPDVRGLDYHDPPTEETADETGAPTETFDTGRWLDEDYEDRAEAVRNGDVDGHLETIVGAETSETVVEAVNERRDELNAGGSAGTGSEAGATDLSTADDDDADDADRSVSDAPDPESTSEIEADDTSGSEG